jgi:hypothetical protein
MDTISPMNLERTPSEEARYARAELETIAAALQVHELAELVGLGREILGRCEAPNREARRGSRRRSRT